MRLLTVGQKAATRARHVKSVMLLHFALLSGDMRLCNVIKDQTFGGHVWKGRGDLIGYEAGTEDASLEVYRTRYFLSGLTPVGLSLALSEPVEGRPFVEYRQFLDPDTGAPIDGPVVIRKGFVSRMTVSGPARRS